MNKNGKLWIWILVFVVILLAAGIVLFWPESEGRSSNDQNSFGTDSDFVYLKSYGTPEELYADFRVALADDDVDALKQTLYDDAMENYGNNEGLASLKGELEGFEYDRFELIEDAWIWKNGEKVAIEGGKIYVKNGSGMEFGFLIMKVGDSWRVVED